MALKVCKNFERNRPLVGANEFYGSVIHVSLTIHKYAYHLIALVLSNFASQNIIVNKSFIKYHKFVKTNFSN